MFDLLIKGGTVVDGTGAPPSIQDVAVADGCIVALGANLSGHAKEVVDAGGCLVTPGFIDPHTHYDAQIAWDGEMLPSSAHGVTTVVTGNCGVGLAPVRKGHGEWLMHVLEVIEDVPGVVMKQALDWNWETFPEYLDAMDEKPFALDVAALLPHTALRAYVMGERGERGEKATPEDLAEMRRIVKEAVEGGAIGFSTSRCSIHQTEHGPLSGTYATDEELLTIAEAIQDAGGGVFQMIPSGNSGVVEGDGKTPTLAGMIPDPHGVSTEVARMRWLHKTTGVNCTFSFGAQPRIGEEYSRAMALLAEAHAAGEVVVPQYPARPMSVLSTLAVQHIFEDRPTYRALAHLPVAERARRMADPAVRNQILTEQNLPPDTEDPLQLFGRTMAGQLENVYLLRDGNRDYTPPFTESLKARAAASGGNPEALFYDQLISNDGRGMLIWFADHTEEAGPRKARYMRNPNFMMGIADGGAHAKLMCDASFPSYFLSHFGKPENCAQPFPVETLVHRMTHLPAKVFGLSDRGEIAVGKRADLNVIDFAKLSVRVPELVADFPTGAERFIQLADGFVMTLVNGVVTRRNDKDTGARPGRIVRKQPAARRSSARVPEMAH